MMDVSSEFTKGINVIQLAINAQQELIESDIEVIKKYKAKEEWMRKELKELRPQSTLLKQIKEWCAKNCFDSEHSTTIEQMQYMIRNHEMFKVCSVCGSCIDCHESNDAIDCHGSEENDDPSDAWDELNETAVLAKKCNFSDHAKYDFEDNK